MLNININVVRNTKNFNVNETRLIINKNENIKNESKVNIIEKKINRQFKTEDYNRKQFNRKAFDSKNSEKLSKFCDRNLKLTKLFL